jgi:hypothetical protein
MEQALATPKAVSRPRGHDGLRLALCLAVLVALGAAGSALHPQLSPARAAGMEGAGWEGRRLVAQLLWAKTHAVMHAGVEEREARQGEAESRKGEFHAHGKGGGSDEHGHDHEEEEAGHVYVIPPAREDFRGLLGDLERNIKPYLAPNGKPYTKGNEQTIPFYRLMTWADPHFIPGYTVGAFFLADAGRNADQALEFLHEGARHNPTSFEIQVELGHAYLIYKKAPERAIPHLKRAVALVPRRELTEGEQEAHLDTYRWLAYCYVRLRRPAEALRVAREGLRIWPGDITFRTVIRNRGEDPPAPLLRTPG